MTQQRIWPNDSGPVNGDVDTSISVGTEFSVTQAVWVTHLRHWRGDSAATKAPDNARLYRITGATTAVLVVEVSSGITSNANSWNEVALGTPVLLSTSQVYKTVFHYFSSTAVGCYMSTVSYWTTGGPGESGITNDWLFAPDATVTADGGQGTYIYSSTPTYPINQFNQTNYWVDVVTTDIDPTVPRVDAGLDSFVIKGDTFSYTAVETLLGVTPTEREWKIVSGPADADAILSTTADVTWTPQPIVGSYVLQYKVTGTGGPFIDTVTVEVIDRGHRRAMRSMGRGVVR